MWIYQQRKGPNAATTFIESSEIMPEPNFQNPLIFIVREIKIPVKITTSRKKTTNFKAWVIVE